MTSSSFEHYARRRENQPTERIESGSVQRALQPPAYATGHQPITAPQYHEQPHDEPGPYSWEHDGSVEKWAAMNAGLPRPEFFSPVERVLFVLFALTGTAAALVWLYVAYMGYQAVSQLQERLSTIPGLSG